MSYLRKREFEALDEPLRVALRKIVTSGNRSVRAVSGSELFPNATIFCDAATAATTGSALSRVDRMKHRFDWLDIAFKITKQCELVFFDPDNGLEIASVPRHHPNAGKYIYWDELIPFWCRGQALLVYHHLNRTKPAPQQVNDLRSRFLARFCEASVLPLVFRRGSCRVFWLVYPNSAMGAELERRASEFLDSAWSKHFRSADWLDESDVAPFAII